MPRFLGIFLAVTVHVGIILFGGLLFGQGKQQRANAQEVDLLSQEQEEKKDEKDEPPPLKDELQTEEEAAPDAAEVIRNLEAPRMDEPPALDAASLGAIEQALNGGLGSGDFADGVDFASGGRIGSNGRGGPLDERLDAAFSLTEIDQKPRAVLQAQPLYPSEMRGKKVEGVVTVLFVVDAGGRIVGPRVEKASHPAFEKPALDAVKQWRFEPAVKAGQRVPCKMRAPIRFQAT